ncbi:hypothetical protein CSPB12327_08550 [Campylobacter sp. RM12327]|uniref:hypothetical protein n=1 Tax=Campylobacter sputorum TaxID=206 RepID=UPI000B77CF49|nr:MULTISPECIES: hypothetical protein [Campylobacter]MBF6670183.1 hypothetical protein [Campylobacter sp. RM12327]
MRYILFSIFAVLLISGCGGKCDRFFSGHIISNSAVPVYNEKWYIDKNNPNSKILYGTKGYGAAADKVKHNYIIKYFNYYDCQEVPNDNVYKIIRKGNEKIYFYTMENNEYKQHSDIWEILDKLLIEECFNDGFCKTYKIDGEIYYVEKKYLKPLNDKN